MGNFKNLLINNNTKIQDSQKNTDDTSKNNDNTQNKNLENEFSFDDDFEAEPADSNINAKNDNTNVKTQTNNSNSNSKYVCKRKEEDRDSWFSSGEVCAGPDGFLLLTESKYGTKKEKVGFGGLIVTSYDFALDSDTATENLFVNVKFKSRLGEIKNMRLGDDFIAEIEKGGDYMKNLVGNGYKLGSYSERKKIAQCISTVEDLMNQNNYISTGHGYVKTGWKNERDILDHVLPGHEAYIADLTPVLQKKGDESENLNFMADIFCKHNTIAFLMSAAAGGLAKGLCFKYGHTPAIVLTGSTSCGKTVALNICSSFYANPNNKAVGTNFCEGTSRQVGFENILAANSNAFVCIDEVGEIYKKPGGPTNLKNIMDNGGRTKGTKNGTEAKNTRTWNTTILAGSNTFVKDALTGTDHDDPLQARLMEVNLDKHKLWSFGKDINKIKEIENFMYENFGHMYNHIIEYIKNNCEEITAQFNANRSMIGECVDNNTDLLNNSINYDENSVAIINRQIDMFAQILCGYTILSNILNVSDAARIKIYNKCLELISDELRKREAKETENDTLSTLINFIRNNIKSIEFRKDRKSEAGYLHSDLIPTQSRTGSQENNAINHNANINKRIAILLQNDEMNDDSDFKGQLLILEEGAKLLQNQGVDVKKLIRTAAVSGFGKVEKENLKSRKRVAGNNLRGYLFYIENKDVLNHINDNTFEFDENNIDTTQLDEIFGSTNGNNEDEDEDFFFRQH